MLKKIFSHSFLYAIGPQVPKFANIIVLPLITPFLTSLDYGVYGTLLAYTGLIQGFKSLGFEILMVNTFYKKKLWKNYWSRYMGGLQLFNLFFSIPYVVFLYYLIPLEAASNLWILILLIVVPATLFDVTKMVGGRYFQLQQKPYYIAIVTSIVGSVSILITLYTVTYLKLGYLGWFISIAFGSLLTFLFYAFPLFYLAKFKFTLSFNKNFWRKGLKVGLPTIPHKYSSYLLNSSDRLVMDQVKTPIEQIGIYNLAYIFGGYLELFGTAVGMAVGPFITKLYSLKTEEGQVQVKNLTFFLQVTFIVICTIIALWVKQLFNLLIRNNELDVAYSISIVIIMGYAYRPLYWAAVNKLIFDEHTKKLWRISFIAGLLNVLLNLIFIPLYGIYAAAITTLFSLMYLGISPYYVKEFKEKSTQKFYPFAWMGSIIFLTITLYVIKDISIWYKVIITVLILISYMGYFYKKRHLINAISV
jgi:O-antigen/teichoic acid export membrane protein